MEPVGIVVLTWLVLISQINILLSSLPE